MDSVDIFCFFTVFFICFAVTYVMYVAYEDDSSDADSDTSSEDSDTAYVYDIMVETPDAKQMKANMDQMMVWINAQADAIAKGAGNADTDLAKLRLDNASKVLLLAQAQLDSAVLLNRLVAAGIDPPTAAKYLSRPPNGNTISALRGHFEAAAEGVKEAAISLRNTAVAAEKETPVRGGEIVRYRLKSTPISLTEEETDHIGGKYHLGKGPAISSKLVLPEAVRGFVSSVMDGMGSYVAMQERRERGLAIPR